MASHTPDVFCIYCSYDLQGRSDTSTSCPECGRDVTYVDDPVVRVPWERRHEIGRIRAFWHTVWLVTFQQQRFAEAYFHELNYAAANRFRWLVSGLAVLTVASLFVTPNGLVIGDDVFGVPYAWAASAIAPLLLLLYWAATIQVSGLYFDNALENRAAAQGLALSLYASAPLAWGFPLALWLLGVRTAGAGHLNEGLDITLEGLRLASPLILWAAWWLLLMNLASRIRRREGWSLTRMELGLALHWALLGGAILVALPVAVTWIVLILEGLAIR